MMKCVGAALLLVSAFVLGAAAADDLFQYALSSLNLDGYVADLLANDVLLGTDSELP